MTVLFIADLHLDPDKPEGIQAFVEFISKDAIRADRLFILGDLFEAWIGDDDDDPRIRPVIEALSTLRMYEVRTYLMHGNRDFLLGSTFARRTGCAIMPDTMTVDIYDQPMLLTHGDLLCTDDIDYQQLRATLRDVDWQQEFLGKPIEERRQIAAELRATSRIETAQKTNLIMDVNQQAVEQMMREHGVYHLIHGHTHRPGIHRFDLDGQQATRIVLGDWYEEPIVLSIDKHGLKLRALIPAAAES